MINRIKFQVGSTTPTLLVASESSWFRIPGAYMRQARGGNEFYIVPPLNAAPRRVEKGEAEAHAWAEFADKSTPDERAAHDHLRVRQDREEARRQEEGAGPRGLDADYPAARDCLAAHACDFEVAAATPTRTVPGRVGERLEGWREIYRTDSGAPLHVASDAYEPIQNRDALSLLDSEATQGRLYYRFAWQSEETRRVRAVGEERGRNVPHVGARVGIRFNIPGVKAPRLPRVEAGGTLVTSHDGSSSIRATACLTFRGTTLFHLRTQNWMHSSKALERVKNGRAALAYLTRAAAGLMRDAEACTRTPVAEAARVVLRAIDPDLFVVPEAGTMDEADRQKVIAERTEKRERALGRLAARAREEQQASQDEEIRANPEVVPTDLGGFAVVLAAPYAFSDRVRAASFYDGSARKRMTEALISLARYSGVREAGLVPATVQEALGAPLPADPDAVPEGEAEPEMETITIIGQADTEGGAS